MPPPGPSGGVSGDHTPADRNSATQGKIPLVQALVGNEGQSNCLPSPLMGAAMSPLLEQNNFHITTVEIPGPRDGTATTCLTPAEMSTLTMLPWQPVTSEPRSEDHGMSAPLFSASELATFKEELRSTGHVKCPIVVR